MTDAETIRLIERDRDTRQSALAALLLLLSRNARRLLNGGMGIVNALRRALLFPGVPVVARAMASAAAAGIARVRSIVGVAERPAESIVDALAGTYEPRAFAALSSSVQTIGRAVRESLAVASFEPVAQETAILRAFQSAGWTDTFDHGATLAAAQAILPAYADGMHTAYAVPEVVQVVYGLELVSVVDEKRTDICRVRHGVKLPLGHEYISRTIPPLHFQCRSIWRPLLRPFKVTEVLPEIPPVMPGFGRGAGVLLRAA